MQNFNIHECLQKGYRIDIGSTISKSWETFKAFAGGFIGYLILLGGALFIINLIPGANVIGSLMQSAFWAGFAVVAHSIAMGETPDFNNFFNGARKNINRYMLASFLSGLIALVFILPFIVLMVKLLFNDPEFEDIARYATQEEMSRYMIEVLPTYVWVVFAIGMFLVIMVTVLFLFVPHFIYFYELSATQALGASYRLILKNYGSMFGLFIVLALINLLGILCLGLGLLVTVPVTLIAIYHAFATLSGLYDNTDKDDEGKHLILDHFR